VTLAKIIPLAFVMIAGPQILTEIFLATSEDWRPQFGGVGWGRGGLDHGDSHRHRPVRRDHRDQPVSG
jgi:hypothetical protein